MAYGCSPNPSVVGIYKDDFFAIFTYDMLFARKL